MTEQLAIAFDGDQKTFEPGATIRGRALWLLSEDPIAAEAATGGWASALPRRPGRPRPLSLLGPSGLRIVAGRDESPACGPIAIEVRLFWRTAGKGDAEIGIVDTARFDAPGKLGDRPFELALPMRPWSCSGRLVSVMWGIEIVALPREDSQHFAITVGPGGREVVLRGGAP